MMRRLAGLAIYALAVADKSVGSADEFCANIHPSCKIGMPVGAKGPASWSGNATQMSAQASRAARPFRKTGRAGRPSSGSYGTQWPEELSRDVHTTIAIHKGHDAHIVVAIGSRIQCVLELERLFGRRYYLPRLDKASSEWHTAMEVVRDRCECEFGPCPREFDTGMILDFGIYESLQVSQFPKLVEHVFRVKRWRHVNHHESHALMAYYSSPFRSSLILSFDGGGNDGTWNAFVGQGSDVYRISRENINLGAKYSRVASFMPAITGLETAVQKVCASFPLDSPRFNMTWSEAHVNWPVQDREGFAGKMMGYSGIKPPSAEMSEWMRQYYVNAERSFDLPGPVLWTICQSEEDRQVVAASTQDEFSKFVQPKIANYLRQLELKSIYVEGIVLVGGCALNVVTNQMIRETLTSFTALSQQETKDRRPQDVYIPPAPNDSGLGIGAVWTLHPPTVRQPLQYLGFRLFDEETLEERARDRGAQRLSELGGVRYLAELLTGGPAWKRVNTSNTSTSKPIIAVVRGRQEFGPRALGHRSLLAVPDTEMRDRMNRIKFRQWWRPAAPMIADEALEYVFGHTFSSAYMEFAPVVREEVRQRFPGLSHFDGTARHQSVGKHDEAWVHALLLAVGQLTGLAALINTSFNSKGKPITNTVEESLEMLDTLPDLDFLLIEDWLFRAPTLRRQMEPSKQTSTVIPLEPEENKRKLMKGA